MQIGNVSPSSVVLIEKHPLAMVELRRILLSTPDIQLLAQSQIDNQRPGGYIFVVDLFGFSLPLRKICEGLVSRYPQGRFVLLAESIPRTDVEHIMALGIQGVVLYSDASSRLSEIIKAISQGLQWISPGVFRTSRMPISTHFEGQVACLDTITPREQQILELAVQRLSNKEIADALEIQECTVKFHLSNIFLKLQVAGRHELVLSHASNDLLKCIPSTVRDSSRRKPTRVLLRSA